MTDAKRLAQVTITVPRRITVDAEIADEIYWLNEHGISTVGCCSGHGKSVPTALITPSSVEAAEAMSYHPEYQGDTGLFQIRLHKSPSIEYRLHETGQQPYSDTTFSAGVVEGHKLDSVYIRLKRKKEPEEIFFLRRDEALAIIRLLAGALWSEQISLHIAQEQTAGLQSDRHGCTSTTV